MLKEKQKEREFLFFYRSKENIIKTIFVVEKKELFYVPPPIFFFFILSPSFFPLCVFSSSFLCPVFNFLIKLKLYPKKILQLPLMFFHIVLCCFWWLWTWDHHFPPLVPSQGCCCCVWMCFVFLFLFFCTLNHLSISAASFTPSLFLRIYRKSAKSLDDLLEALGQQFWSRRDHLLLNHLLFNIFKQKTLKECNKKCFLQWAEWREGSVDNLVYLISQCKVKRRHDFSLLLIWKKKSWERKPDTHAHIHT